MKLMVPTLMCKAMVAMDIESLNLKSGQIIEIPYGPALALKAGGGIKALLDEDAKHLEAQEHLAIYGADGWFPQDQQTISRVADYLAAAGAQTETTH